MREDEANFIGYLACTGSESRSFRYSGYLTGWVYAGNALAKADYDGFIELYKKLDEKPEMTWKKIMFSGIVLRERRQRCPPR